MAGVRPAGARSGTHTGGIYLDGARSFSGCVGDTLRKDCRSTSVSAPTHIHVGGGQTCEVLPSRQASCPGAGSTSRRPGAGHHHVAIPGYGGHISGKAAENMHGSTFRFENQRADRHLSGRELSRTQSEPSMPSAATKSLGGSGSKALSTAPRMPGYTGCYPGKIAQIVHGVRFAEACEQAQVQRIANPTERTHTSSQWSKRFTKANTTYILTDEEDRQARQETQHLGCTRGLTTEKVVPFRQPWYGWPSAQPGSIGCPASRASRGAAGSPRTSDRLVNSLHSNKVPSPKATTPACGQTSVSAKLDQQRWLMHNALLLGDGNQRTV